LDEVKFALQNIGVAGMTVTRRVASVARVGTSRSTGQGVRVRLRGQIHIESSATDETVDLIVDAIVAAARTDSLGDGKVWVTGIESVVRVRTNERGPKRCSSAAWRATASAAAAAAAGSPRYRASMTSSSSSSLMR